MADKRTEIVLGYKTDKASVAKVIADTKKMSESLSASATGGQLSGKKSSIIANEESRVLDKVVELQRKRVLEEAKLLELSASALGDKVRALKAEQKANNEAIAVIRKSGASADIVAQKTEELERANMELAQSLDFIATKAMPNATKATNAFARSAQDDYDEVNKNVALAGDVASNAAQVGGALRAVGADFAGNALEGAVVLGDLAEGLPRLKSAIGGLPEVAGSAVKALGPVGVGLIAVLGLGALAFSEISKEVDKARLAGEAYANALADAGAQVADARQALARGDTESAFAQLKAIQDQRLNLILQQEEANRALAEAEALKNQFFVEEFGVFNSIAEALNPAMAQVNANFNTATANSQKLGDEMLSIATQQEELTNLLLAQGFTTQEIEEAIANLNNSAEEATETVNELSTALLAQADAVRNRYLEELSLLDQSEQALRDRQIEINNEITANQRALDVLRMSGDTSEEVTEQIRQYEEANKALGDTLAFIGSTALPQATARAQAEQVRVDTAQTQGDIINATKKYNDTLETINADGQKAMLDIEQKRTDTLLSIAKKYADDTENALNKLNADLSSSRAKYTDDELKARQTALNAELDTTRKHYQSLEDISVNAKREESDALRNLDFKSAFDARRNANRAIEDEQKKFSREAQDRQINLERERKERLQAYARAQSDAQANYRKELQQARQNQERALAEARAGYAQEQAQARNTQTQKLRDLQAGYAQEIALARQTTAQRLALQAQADAQLLAQAQRLLAGLSRPQFTPTPQRPAPRPTGNTPSSPPPTSRIPGLTPVININGAGNPRRIAEQVRGIINGGRGGGR